MVVDHTLPCSSSAKKQIVIVIFFKEKIKLPVSIIKVYEFIMSNLKVKLKQKHFNNQPHGPQFSYYAVGPLFNSSFVLIGFVEAESKIHSRSLLIPILRSEKNKQENCSLLLKYMCKPSVFAFFMYYTK